MPFFVYLHFSHHWRLAPNNFYRFIQCFWCDTVYCLPRWKLFVQTHLCAPSVCAIFFGAVSPRYYVDR